MSVLRRGSRMRLQVAEHEQRMVVAVRKRELGGSIVIRGDREKRHGNENMCT
jgi:hypothetical protein